MTPFQAELSRRRRILARHIGYELCIKRGYLRPKDRLCGLVGRLVEVRRTKAILDFGEPGGGQWNVPIIAVLLPYSCEPAPGQRELFA
jgi:hypothetical protein